MADKSVEDSYLHLSVFRLNDNGENVNAPCVYVYMYFIGVRND